MREERAAAAVEAEKQRAAAAADRAVAAAEAEKKRFAKAAEAEKQRAAAAAEAENQRKAAAEDRRALLAELEKERGACKEPNKKTKTVKLQTLQMRMFSGKSIDWPKWFASCETAVDSRDDLTTEQKFTYLESYLKGQAKKIMKNLEPSQENYDEAIELLVVLVGTLKNTGRMQTNEREVCLKGTYPGAEEAMIPVHDTTHIVQMPG